MKKEILSAGLAVSSLPPQNIGVYAGYPIIVTVLLLDSSDEPEVSILKLVGPVTRWIVNVPLN